MTAQPKDRLGPSAAFHMVGAHHDFIDILHTKIRVIEAGLAIEARKGQVGVCKEEIVMLKGAITPGVNAKCGLKVGGSEVEPISYERERRSRI